MNKPTDEVPCTERELERKVPESVHDNFGGQRGRKSTLTKQLKHDAERTKERLEENIEDSHIVNKTTSETD